MVGVTLALRLLSPHPEAWFLVGYPDSPYHEQRSYWLRPVLWPPAEVVLDHPWAVLDVEKIRICLDVGTVLACGLLAYLVPGTVLLLPLWEGVGQFAPAPWAALMAVVAARYGTKVSLLLPLFRQEDVVISLADAIERRDLWAIPLALAAAFVTPLFNYILLGDPWATSRFMVVPSTLHSAPLRDIVCASVTGIPVLLSLRGFGMGRVSKFMIGTLVIAAVIPGSYIVSAPERYLLPVGAYLMARGVGPGAGCSLPVLACSLGLFLGFALQPWTLHVNSHLDNVHGVTYQTFMGIPCLVGNFLAVESLKHGSEIWIPPFVPKRIQSEYPKILVKYLWKGKSTTVWYLSPVNNNIMWYTRNAWKIWGYSREPLEYEVYIKFSYYKRTVLIWGRKL